MDNKKILQFVTELNKMKDDDKMKIEFENGNQIILNHQDFRKYTELNISLGVKIGEDINNFINILRKGGANGRNHNNFQN